MQEKKGTVCDSSYLVGHLQSNSLYKMSQSVLGKHKVPAHGTYMMNYVDDISVTIKLILVLINISNRQIHMGRNDFMM